ncbi:hypothetical protein YC2023_106461 [Brassica napus]
MERAVVNGAVDQTFRPCTFLIKGTSQSQHQKNIITQRNRPNGPSRRQTTNGLRPNNKPDEPTRKHANETRVTFNETRRHVSARNEARHASHKQTPAPSASRRRKTTANFAGTRRDQNATPWTLTESPQPPPTTLLQSNAIESSIETEIESSSNLRSSHTMNSQSFITVKNGNRIVPPEEARNHQKQEPATRRREDHHVPESDFSTVEGTTATLNLSESQRERREKKSLPSPFTHSTWILYMAHTNLDLNKSFTEEKLRSRSITLVFSRRVTSRGWAPSGVASSLDGRPTFRSGVRAFFSGVGRPAQVLSGYGLIRPDLSFRRRIYLRWTAGFCFRRPHLLLRCWTAGFCLRVTIFLGGDGGLLSGLPDYGFDLRFLWFSWSYRFSFLSSDRRRLRDRLMSIVF